MKLEPLTIARVNYRCQQKVPVSVSCCGSASLPYISNRLGLGGFWSILKLFEETIKSQQGKVYIKQMLHELRSASLRAGN